MSGVPAGASAAASAGAASSGGSEEDRVSAEELQDAAGEETLLQTETSRSTHTGTLAVHLGLSQQLHLIWYLFILLMWYTFKIVYGRMCITHDLFTVTHNRDWLIDYIKWWHE